MAIEPSDTIIWADGPTGQVLSADNLNKINYKTKEAIEDLQNNIEQGEVVAQKAQQDSSGNTITSTYATKNELSSLQNNITGGSITAKKAEKAEKDASGNVITSTYCTKNEAQGYRTEFINAIEGGTLVPTKVDIGTDSKIQNQLISDIFVNNSPAVKQVNSSFGTNAAIEDIVKTFYKGSDSNSVPSSQDFSDWAGDDTNIKSICRIGSTLKIVDVSFKDSRQGKWWNGCKIVNDGTFHNLLTIIPSYYTTSVSNQVYNDNAPVLISRKDNNDYYIYIRGQSDSNSNIKIRLSMFFN